MPLTDEQYRQGAIEYINKYCNQNFVDGDLPMAIELAIEELIKYIKTNKDVQSQSLGDMSKSFFQGGTLTAANNYLLPYRRPKALGVSLINGGNNQENQ